MLSGQGGLSVRVDSSSQKTDVWTFICVAAPAVFYSSIATLVCSGRMPELDHSLVLRSPLYRQNDLKCYFTWEYRMPAGFYVLFLFLWSYFSLPLLKTNEMLNVWLNRLLEKLNRKVEHMNFSEANAFVPKQTSDSKYLLTFSFHRGVNNYNLLVRTSRVLSTEHLLVKDEKKILKKSYFSRVMNLTASQIITRKTFQKPELALMEKGTQIEETDKYALC